MPTGVFGLLPPYGAYSGTQAPQPAAQPPPQRCRRRRHRSQRVWSERLLDGGDNRVQVDADRAEGLGVGVIQEPGRPLVDLFDMGEDSRTVHRRVAQDPSPRCRWRDPATPAAGAQYLCTYAAAPAL